ncbi:XTP/dITP diphosphohydrolase [Thermodesulfitimonas autotrophica]|uniref:dITP/XTP pyrophosphatase n=1 Tax=Thermodesulfitimonas autotrophica TaxID=1894989 RepID=A0A3N5AQ23_9THEO|nr:XTP/dITP diphosphatase [Thermodesulfitimonas autotrophica]RPF46974.1 XTP/dITP diphosphohydrolase [Thermodesulfitimonas autotrophica]
MKRIVVATTNQGKLKEIEEILAPLGLSVTSLAAYPGFPEIEEDGATFKENAVKKAQFTATFTGEIALADDSGLEVDYLGGAPGVRSARFAGEPKNDAANNAKLLRLLASVPWEKRTARFRCVIAVATPNGEVATAEGTAEGYILTAPRGTGGFGYDPLFYFPEYGKTFAELPPEVKNQVSHRGRALAKLKEVLATLLAGEK